LAREEYCSVVQVNIRVNLGRCLLEISSHTSFGLFSFFCERKCWAFFSCMFHCGLGLRSWAVKSEQRPTLFNSGRKKDASQTTSNILRRSRIVVILAISDFPKYLSFSLLKHISLLPIHFYVYLSTLTFCALTFFISS
jgi:hypothetical protein